MGVKRRGEAKQKAEFQAIQKGNIPKGSPYRLHRLLGDFNNPNKQNESSKFCHTKYAFLLEAPFEVSERCCGVMKKAPSRNYEKQTGRKPILATMTEESRLRLQRWFHEGCNAFEAKHQTSKPMSFWTEQDVLEYINKYNVPICSVYGDIVEVSDEEIEGQMTFSECAGCDTSMFDAPKAKHLETTGCKRTGCMFCGFGCQNKDDRRFVDMKKTHPKQYEWIMKPTSEGGLGYKEIIDWMNEHGNLNIKY